MNLALFESFGQNYPEEFDGILDCESIAITCAFNRRGTLLAVGCNDGRVVIWDFLTRGIAKMVNAHVHPVCSISWSRDSHKLLTASTDNTVSIWEVLTGNLVHTYRFPSPVLRVQFHPRKSWQFLVCPMKHASVIMDVNGEHQVVPLDDDSDLNVVASYDRRGEFIYTGNAKARVLVFQSSDELDLCASFRLTGSTSSNCIKQIEFAHRGSHVLINSADRVIRIYDSREIMSCGKDGDPQPIQKLHDLVNKTMWKKCVFSGDGEYIAAGSARQHSIYIWERASGTILKDLHGTKGEVMLDLSWHPLRPTLCSVSNGVVSCWSQSSVENWSAFAPDFKELDENVEYEERESEFDHSDEDKPAEPKKDAEEEEEVGEIDVVGCERVTALLSSDEEAADDDPVDEFLFLPIATEVDDPEESVSVAGGGAAVGLSPTEVAKRKVLVSPGAPSTPKTITVSLPGASSSTSDYHPLVQPVPPRKAPASSQSNASRDADLKKSKKTKKR